MRVIDIEAHFSSPEFFELLRAQNYRGFLLDPLLDVAEKRIKDMDAAGVDVQVLSLAEPAVQQLEASEGIPWARKMNDFLADVIKRNPKRFLGYASVALQSPKEAADELERAVTELGFKGLNINSHTRNEYLDDKKFWPIWERAEKLDVPVYIHPTGPSAAIIKGFEGYGPGFSAATIGYGVEVSLHATRLIFSGLFDKYPKLKIILGHMGEAMPYTFFRMDFAWKRVRAGGTVTQVTRNAPVVNLPKLELKPSDYFKRNFYITTSGVPYQPPFVCAVLAIGVDSILFASDYPYEQMTDGMKFMSETPVCESDKAKIFHKNAERILKL